MLIKSKESTRRQERKENCSSRAVTRKSGEWRWGCGGLVELATYKRVGITLTANPRREKVSFESASFASSGQVWR